MKPFSKSPYRKATALLLAGVVFVLGLAAISPDIHEKLHAGDTCHTDATDAGHHHDSKEGDGHYCAVTILQFGASWALDPVVLEAVSGTINYSVEAPELPTPRLFAPPGNRGPPIVELA